MRAFCQFSLIAVSAPLTFTILHATLFQSLGQVGRVIKVFPTGDVRVAVNGRTWTYNPQCLQPAPGENPPEIPRESIMMMPLHCLGYHVLLASFPGLHLSFCRFYTVRKKAAEWSLGTRLMYCCVWGCVHRGRF